MAVNYSDYVGYDWAKDWAKEYCIGRKIVKSNVIAPTPTQPMSNNITKEKNYAICSSEGWYPGLTEAEAIEKANEQAHSSQKSVYILKVDSVVKPKRETVREEW